MADPNDADTLKPMTDGDIDPPPATTEFQPAAALKDAGVSFSPADDDATGMKAFWNTKQSVRDNTSKLREQAGGKARTLAEDGKARATGALEQLSQMLRDAAGTVDEKVGAQYGQYARTAADSVQSFSSSLDDQSVDELVETAREFVRKSPAVAIGAAAALGFLVARLLTSGLDQRGEG